MQPFRQGLKAGGTVCVKRDNNGLFELYSVGIAARPAEIVFVFHGHLVTVHMGSPVLFRLAGFRRLPGRRSNGGGF